MTLEDYRKDDQSALDIEYKCTPSAFINLFDNYMWYSAYERDEKLRKEMYEVLFDFINEVCEWPFSYGIDDNVVQIAPRRGFSMVEYISMEEDGKHVKLITNKRR